MRSARRRSVPSRRSSTRITFRRRPMNAPFAFGGAALSPDHELVAGLFGMASAPLTADQVATIEAARTLRERYLAKQRGDLRSFQLASSRLRASIAEVKAPAAPRRRLPRATIGDPTSAPSKHRPAEPSKGGLSDRRGDRAATASRSGRQGARRARPNLDDARRSTPPNTPASSVSWETCFGPAGSTKRLSGAP